jgi:hypothetical protein
MRITLGFLALLTSLALLPALATGHAERLTFFPDGAQGQRPERRSTGPSLVVCKPDSAKRVKRSWRGSSKTLTRRREYILRILDKRCRFRHIQQAVDAARTGDRILVMPGIYKEEPSRKIPVKDPKCEGDGYWEASGDNHQEDGRVPTYKHQVDCPNSRNLIAVIGDDLGDPDQVCDRKCNLQMQGMGRKPEDVQIIGDRLKQDVIRADRADGFQLDNVLVEQGGYNNVDLVETNGFRITRVITRWAKNYGILTFTSDNGLYDRVEAYGNGDSGIYPGSGPEGHCARYGIVVQNSVSYGNTLGSSGTAGNGTWYRNNKLYDNSAGVAIDSFAPGHPGMPQDCSKWTDNEIYSNNRNVYEDENEAYCNSTPFEARRKEVVCPQFQGVVGTGLMLYGANENVVQNNRIYDNWRSGVRLYWVPAAARGETDPTKQSDTSNGNRVVDNLFGVGPGGKAMPNGQDITWDEQGVGNCWQDNKTFEGKPLTSDPALLPTCASGGSNALVSNPAKTATELPCVQWHPRDNPDPPGCSWFTTPPKPGS